MTSRLAQTALLAAAATLLAGTTVFAQTPPTTPAPAPPAPSLITLSATIESFYEFNANRPPDRVNILRAYDSRANTFGLQQGALVIESPVDLTRNRRAGLRIDLQVGMATEAVQGNAANEPRPDVYRHLWQGYGSYVLPWRGVRLDIGKFASNLGFETNYAKDNNNFSRALLFNFLPFYHSGVRATLPLTSKVSVLYMLTNGIQQTEDFNDFKSNQFTVVVTPASPLTWTSSYYFGQEQPDGGESAGPNGWFRVIDSYAVLTITKTASAGIDVNYVSSESAKGGPRGTLTGAAVYGRYQASALSAIAVRYEHLDDRGGLFAGSRQRLQEVTATVERQLTDGLLLRGEFRRDHSNQKLFAGPLGATDRRAQPTLLVGMVWWMGDKKGAW